MKGLIVTLLFLSSFVSNVFGNQTRLDLLKVNIPEIKLNNEFQGTVDINNYAQKNYIKRLAYIKNNTYLCRVIKTIDYER